MELKERILHAVLFELGALAVGAIAVILAGLGEAGSAAIVSAIIAMIAMLWNFIFNFFYDRIYTGARENRGFMQRAVHAILFECGLLIATVPIIAYFLNLSWFEAFLADIGITLVILVYTMIFNWVYDKVRLRFVKA